MPLFGNPEQFLAMLRGDPTMLREMEQLIKKAKFEHARESTFVPTEVVAKLKKLYTEYATPAKFKPGDLVEWREGMAYSDAPREAEPAVVIGLVDPPAVEEGECDCARYTEPLDLKLGVLTIDGMFVIQTFPAKRFKRFKLETITI